ncbi:hypothetical protein GCM10027290_54900 [Micromonospora sonneratiae]|uniref:Uncharacterized protein n=1 Tax=Micromonospora sonneratiae TaxID=1184706 RepID=A0ABW3YK93_9ACTN
MQNIVINESYLRKLQATYAELVDDIDRIYGKIYPYGALPESKVDFTKPFTLHLGGAGFSEAVALVERIDSTRAGLAERFKSARGELNTLEFGIKFLLADSEATEELGTLSAEQFEYFMPQSGGS